MKRKLVFNIHPLKPRRQLLREKSTQGEKILWERLRKEKLGFKFFRQYSVEGYVVDFYCPTKRLAIEIEGSVHNLPEVHKYDEYRYRYIKAYNIKILKFTNQELFLHIGHVLEAIKTELHTPS